MEEKLWKSSFPEGRFQHATGEKERKKRKKEKKERKKGNKERKKEGKKKYIYTHILIYMI